MSSESIPPETRITLVPPDPESGIEYYQVQVPYEIQKKHFGRFVPPGN